MGGRVHLPKMQRSAAPAFLLIQAQTRRVDQLENRGRKSFVVPRLHEDSGTSKNLWDSRRTGRHNRATMSHRLSQGVSKGLDTTRVYQAHR